MFDRVKISVKSGKGGDGLASFRHEKFVPFGGPDGGDGGKGGDVILLVDINEDTLKKYYLKKEYVAENGKPGQHRKKHGKSGKNLVLRIPPGTVVTDITDPDNPQILADMDTEGDTLVAAKGGKGGLGNTHFTSSTNQAPRLASVGEGAEEKILKLELKLIADVGIIGLPNAGKSSLLSACSGAKPKIAGYPFTTLEPELGTVVKGKSAFVMADIPGLIEGAADGKGLGYEFLRHIIRTRLLVHLIDGSAPKPLEDFKLVNQELKRYDTELLYKQQIVVINKIDKSETQARIGEIIREFATEGINPLFISALTGEGVDGLVDRVDRQLTRIAAESPVSTSDEKKVFKPEPRKQAPLIKRENDKLLVIEPELERLVAGSDIGNAEVRRQLWKMVERKVGVKTLEKAGAMPGDLICIGDFEWRW
ncbi:MAG: GTPase ObgE [Dehalococcoidales bacterium]|nr:GTPase ObgE [Dehalococcoidales bacterium]MDD4230237.1 GTPase ObgE [Dehalococcoidales bacterium]MDD4465482.1 GTPase ObgE [Dehalococcoidales bacterium]MDD5402133.1 GTPase ObgE [Dehalococcoidales bacterium]